MSDYPQWVNDAPNPDYERHVYDLYVGTFPAVSTTWPNDPGEYFDE